MHEISGGKCFVRRWLLVYCSFPMNSRCSTSASVGGIAGNASDT